MSHSIPLPRPGQGADKARMDEILRVDHAGEYGAVAVAGGQVSVAAGCVAQGQGHETTLRQIVAGELGIAVEHVAKIDSDTALVRDGILRERFADTLTDALRAQLLRHGGHFAGGQRGVVRLVVVLVGLLRGGDRRQRDPILEPLHGLVVPLRDLRKIDPRIMPRMIQRHLPARPRPVKAQERVMPSRWLMSSWGRVCFEASLPA